MDVDQEKKMIGDDPAREREKVHPSSRHETIVHESALEERDLHIFHGSISIIDIGGSTM